MGGWVWSVEGGLMELPRIIWMTLRRRAGGVEGLSRNWERPWRALARRSWTWSRQESAYSSEAWPMAELKAGMDLRQL